jgi:hypothetical protein
MSIVLPRFRIGKTGYRQLNTVIAAVETALNGTFTGTLPIATSDVTGLDTALAAKAPLASPTFTGAVTLPKTVGTVQALVAAGAVDLTNLVTTIASGGAIALTLADGAAGQLKVISMITDGGDATLTPTNLQGGTTITFNDVGDTVTLLFVGTKWAIIANTGATVA